MVGWVCCLKLDVASWSSALLTGSIDVSQVRVPVTLKVCHTLLAETSHPVNEVVNPDGIVGTVCLEERGCQTAGECVEVVLLHPSRT